MAEKVKLYEFELNRIEKGAHENYKFVFDTDKLGEYYLESQDKNLFDFNNKYIAQVKTSGIPDFIGEENKMENVSTITISLEKILESDRVIWKKLNNF